MLRAGLVRMAGTEENSARNADWLSEGEQLYNTSMNESWVSKEFFVFVTVVSPMEFGGMAGS